MIIPAKIQHPDDRSRVWVGPMLRREQDDAIVRMMAEPTKSALIASEMGTGKTVVSIEFALRMGFTRLLLIGVKDTFDQWAERIAAQSDEEVSLRRIDATAPGKLAFADFLAGEDGWYFSGSQMLTSKDWESVQEKDDFTGEGLTKLDDKKTGAAGTATFSVNTAGVVEATKKVTRPVQLKIYKKMKPLDAIIFDEIHVVANRKSNGLRTLRVIPTEWKLAMSDTWYLNSFTGAWSVTSWLWPTLIDSFTRWQSEWCATETVYVAGGRTATKVTGEKIPGEFVKTLPLYLREEAKEKQPAPELFYVDLSPAQREQYDDLERDLVLWMDTQDGGRDVTIADFPLVLRSRLRSMALGEISFVSEDGDIGFDLNTESSKLFELRQILDSPEWTGRPVAIYTHDKRFAKITVARMRAAGYNAVEWSGDVTSANRKKIKAGFLDGSIQYLVCVIAAFNAGLDGFQRVCNRVIWLSELEGNGALNSQALGRFFRPGRVGEFRHAKILANDTHDVGIYSKGVMDAMRNRQTLALAA